MIIQVDKKDKEIKRVEKLEAHQKGLLHRAFSVFIIGKKGFLIQKRASQKYHSGNLWANACCSHPVTEGDIKKEAQKRLFEEIGFSTELKKIGEESYKVEVGDLIENEYDHLFLGIYDGEVKPNPEEVSEYAWLSILELEKEISQNPTKFGPWFLEIYPKVKEKIIKELESISEIENEN